MFRSDGSSALGEMYLPDLAHGAKSKTSKPRYGNLHETQVAHYSIDAF